MERTYKIILNDKSEGKARLRLVQTAVASTEEVTTDRGHWVSSASYAAGDQVTHGGNVWVAVEPSTGSEPSLENPAWRFVGIIDRSSLTLVVTASDTVDDGTQENWGTVVTATIYSDGQDVTSQFSSEGWVIRGLSDALRVVHVTDTPYKAAVTYTEGSATPTGTYTVQAEYSPLRLSGTINLLRLDVQGIINSGDIATIEKALALIGENDAIAKKALDDAKADLAKRIADLDRDRPPVWEIVPSNIVPGAPVWVSRETTEEPLRSVTIVPRYLRNGIDQTDLLKDATIHLNWYRVHILGVDDKGVTDAEWDDLHKGRTQVTLTHEDIKSAASIYIEAEADELEAEYKRLKK